MDGDRREVDRFLVDTAPALKPANDASVLRREIRMLVQACEQASDRERARIAELAAAYLLPGDCGPRGLPGHAHA